MNTNLIIFKFLILNLLWFINIREYVIIFNNRIDVNFADKSETY